MSGCLLNGFDLLLKTNPYLPGGFYSAFSQLSVGIERLMKIVLIMDYLLTNNLIFPKNKFLRDFGHSLDDCYDACATIGCKFGVKPWLETNSLERRVLKFLADFAQTNRYYNLDQLVGGKSTNDPLSKWIELHFEIAQKFISNKKQKKIFDAVEKGWSGILLVTPEKDEKVGRENAIKEFFHAEILRKSQGYCIWTFIEILRPFYGLLDCLTSEIHKIDFEQGNKSIPLVPYMTEFVPFFLCDKQTCTSRRNWLGTYIK